MTPILSIKKLKFREVTYPGSGYNVSEIEFKYDGHQSPPHVFSNHFINVPLF